MEYGRETVRLALLRGIDDGLGFGGATHLDCEDRPAFPALLHKRGVMFGSFGQVRRPWQHHNATSRTDQRSLEPFSSIKGVACKHLDIEKNGANTANGLDKPGQPSTGVGNFGVVVALGLVQIAGAEDLHHGIGALGARGILPSPNDSRHLDIVGINDRLVAVYLRQKRLERVTGFVLGCHGSASLLPGRTRPLCVERRG